MRQESEANVAVDCCVLEPIIAAPRFGGIRAWAVVFQFWIVVMNRIKVKEEPFAAKTGQGKLRVVFLEELGRADCRDAKLKVASSIVTQILRPEGETAVCSKAAQFESQSPDTPTDPFQDSIFLEEEQLPLQIAVVFRSQPAGLCLAHCNDFGRSGLLDGLGLSI